MSIFTDHDFEMLAKGYLLRDILKDHIENWEELYKFYEAFYKDWNGSVDSRMNLLNIPQMSYRLDTSPEEDFKNTYPDCNEEVLDAIYEFYDKLSCNWAQFLEAWNNSIMSTNDRMHLEFPMCDIPKFNLTLSFPKKYLIGDYDD